MTLRDHLQVIYDQFGRLTPELVVQVARDEEHPLHAHVFDREPGDAAEAWYRHRAHDLIQRVTVTYKDRGNKDQSIRAFHAVSTPDAGFVYEPADRIAADPFLREMVLRDMERDWKQLKARYGHFREFAQLVAADVPEAVAA